MLSLDLFLKNKHMRHCIFLFILLFVPLSVYSQRQTNSIHPEGKYSTFYYQRASLFELLPVSHMDIFFVGNSISNGGEWTELFEDPRIKNRGISGDICEGVYDRLEPLLRGKPAKIFLMIGINDLARGTSPDSVVASVTKIIGKIRNDSPGTEIFLQSILPLNDSYGMFEGHTQHSRIIAPLNEQLREMARCSAVTFIDLYSHFVNPGSDRLDTLYSNDGLHLMGEGYLKWAEIVKPYLEE